MKLEGYEYLKGFVTPAYWYEEGKSSEEYFVDSLTLFCKKFPNVDSEEEDKREWWIIAPYKPIGVTIDKTNLDLIKWLVEDCYCEDSDEYECYEWNFDKHCVKYD